MFLFTVSRHCFTSAFRKNMNFKSDWAPYQYSETIFRSVDLCIPSHNKGHITGMNVFK